MLTELSKEQLSIVNETYNEFMNSFYTTHLHSKINEKDFEEGVKYLYDKLGLKTPKIIYCDSWISCLLCVEIFHNKQLIDKSVTNAYLERMEKNFFYSVLEKVDSDLFGKIRNIVMLPIAESTARDFWRPNINQICYSDRNAVHHINEGNFNIDLTDSVIESIKNIIDCTNIKMPLLNDAIMKFYWRNSPYINAYKYHTLAEYVCYERLGLFKDEEFDNYKKLLSGVFNSYLFADFVFAVKMPLKVNIDENRKLHSINEASIIFNDGIKYHFIHGQFIDETLFKRILNNEYTFDEFLMIKDIELRNAIMQFIKEKHGYNEFLKFMTSKLTETDSIKDIKNIENEIKVCEYTLYNGENSVFLKIDYQHLNESFFVEVDKSIKNIREAILSLRKIERKLVDEIDYILLKENVVNIALTVKGKEISRTLKKTDFKDLVNIRSIEKFFELVRY